MGFFDSLNFERLKKGLSKTRENLFGKIHRIVTGKGKIDESLFENIEEILIEGDVGVSTTSQIIENLKKYVRSEKIEDPSAVEEILREEVKRIFDESNQNEKNKLNKTTNGLPYTILIVGVNGVGKTTTIGKLAYNFRNSGKSVIIAASDTFRAAANEQLEIWAQRAGVEIITQLHGADPAAVAYDALNSAKSRGIEVLIIDTAGRLHTKVNLMEELKKIKRVLQKINPNLPDEVYLVIDASTGQNAMQQLRQFNEAIGVTGIIITKLDGTAKGGVVLSLVKETGIPVKYIGIGEKITDLEPFDKVSFARALCERT